MEKTIDAMEAAKFLISLDPERKYFNFNFVSDIASTDREPYEGNVRLNKILHLANNAYIGKTGHLLINEPFYAYKNGGVIPLVQKNYANLIAEDYKNHNFMINGSICIYLIKVYTMLKDCPIKELIEIDHEDPAWQEKKDCVGDAQIMDSLKYSKEYQLQYDGANMYIDNLEIA